MTTFRDDGSAARELWGEEGAPGPVDRVVVLTIDALNAGHLPWHGYDGDTAPFLTELAGENAVFERCYSVSSHTREAMPSMLSGRYPLRAADGGYRLAAPTVAGQVPGASGMFHSNPFISRAYGYGGEFDAFDDDLWLGRNRLVALARRVWAKLVNRHYARAEQINDRSRRWLETEGEEASLVWNHYMDVHGPHDPPERDRRAVDAPSRSARDAQLLLHRAKRSPDAIADEERRALVDLYDAEIHYVDRQIRSFVEWLRRTGRWERTALLITADHGEGLGSEGFYEHPRRLTEGLLHVPMVLAGPDVPAERIGVPVSVRQTPATVLALLGEEPDRVDGSPITAPEGQSWDGERYVFAQVSEKRSSAVQVAALGRDATATARVGRDGDVALGAGEDASSLDRGRAVEAALADHIEEQIDGGIVERDEEPEDDRLRRRLEALGYHG